MLRPSYQLLEAEVSSNKRQWDGDSKPQSKKSNKRAEWHSGTAALDPQDQIEHKEHSEYDPKHSKTAEHSTMIDCQGV